jgi:hypothetical protein
MRLVAIEGSLCRIKVEWSFLSQHKFYSVDENMSN